MTRILFVSTSSTIGGAEKTLYTLATCVRPSDYPVAGVVSLKPKGHYALALEKAGVKTWSLDMPPKPGLRDLRRLAMIIHEAKPDVVHAIMYQAIQLCRAVRRLGYADFKLISSPRVHYRTRTGLSLWIDRFLRGADDLLISECEASRKYLVETMKYPAGKVITIYNGVDIAGWPISMVERRKYREKAGVPESSVLLGCVGRLDAQKGQSFLLEAIAKLKVLHPVKCLLIGKGPLKARLEELARKLRITQDVFFVGEQQDIAGWLCALDIFVQPSLWEGLPNAMLEAMALGLPVVATRVDGVPEAVAHEISGLLCPPKDSQALMVCIQDLIADKELRRKLGEGARSVVVENFSLARMIPKYEAAYAQVAAAP